MSKAFTKLKLDHAGLGEILASSSIQSAVAIKAREIASMVRSGVAKDAERGVVVDLYTAKLRRDVIPRHAASVTVRDVRARAWQALYGILSGPAHAVGLEVRLK